MALFSLLAPAASFVSQLRSAAAAPNTFLFNKEIKLRRKCMKKTFCHDLPLSVVGCGCCCFFCCTAAAIANPVAAQAQRERDLFALWERWKKQLRVRVVMKKEPPIRFLSYKCWISSNVNSESMPMWFDCVIGVHDCFSMRRRSDD